MRRRRILVFCCAMAVALGFAPASWAQGDAPSVDPDSPAGTEYQLPIDQARKDARGGGSTGSSGPATRTPLFGEGVKPKASGSAKKARPDGGATMPTTTTGEEPALSTSTPDTVRAQAPAPDSGSGGLAAIGAGGAGVLLIGGLAGLAWRRRSVRR